MTYTMARDIFVLAIILAWGYLGWAWQQDRLEKRRNGWLPRADRVVRDSLPANQQAIYNHLRKEGIGHRDALLIALRKRG